MPNKVLVRIILASYFKFIINNKMITYLVLLSLGWSEALQHQYGLASVDAFCKGWGELDQLGDVASELMSAKYPHMGSLRVSKFEKVAAITFKAI